MKRLLVSLLVLCMAIAGAWLSVGIRTGGRCIPYANCSPTIALAVAVRGVEVKTIGRTPQIPISRILPQHHVSMKEPLPGIPAEEAVIRDLACATINGVLDDGRVVLLAEWGAAGSGHDYRASTASVTIVTLDRAGAIQHRIAFVDANADHRWRWLTTTVSSDCAVILYHRPSDDWNDFEAVCIAADGATTGRFGLAAPPGIRMGTLRAVRGRRPKDGLIMVGDNANSDGPWIARSTDKTAVWKLSGDGTITWHKFVAGRPWGPFDVVSIGAGMGLVAHTPPSSDLATDLNADSVAAIVRISGAGQLLWSLGSDDVEGMVAGLAESVTAASDGPVVLVSDMVSRVGAVSDGGRLLWAANAWSPPSPNRIAHPLPLWWGMRADAMGGVILSVGELYGDLGESVRETSAYFESSGRRRWVDVYEMPAGSGIDRPRLGLMQSPIATSTYTILRNKSPARVLWPWPWTEPLWRCRERLIKLGPGQRMTSS